MKRIAILIIALTAAVAAFGQERGGKPRAEELWNMANTAYSNGNYRAAIQIYDSIVTLDMVSPKLYYNMGNAYFKEDKIGKAILYYNRSLRLDPSNRDTQHNLTVAASHAKDNIEIVPEFFIKTWVRNLRLSMGSNAWAVLSLVFFALLLAGTMLYLLPQSLTKRKAGFATAVTSLVLFIVTTWFSAAEKREMESSSQAVVMSNSAPVKSSPDNASMDIFILHEGTTVKVLNSLNDWREISIADGKKGWINAKSIESI